MTKLKLPFKFYTTSGLFVLNESIVRYYVDYRDTIFSGELRVLVETPDLFLASVNRACRANYLSEVWGKEFNKFVELATQHWNTKNA